MSGSEALWFNDGALTVTNAKDDSDIVLAGLKGITITPSFEINKYYTADSTFRNTAKQYEHDVSVEIEYAFFSLDVAGQWLGGQGTTTATASTDTSDPMRFDIEVITQSADGTWERTAAVSNVIFPEMPIVDGSQDEFEEFGLSGSGDEVTNLADTSGA